MTNLEKIMKKINTKTIIATIASELVNDCETCPMKEFCETRKIFACQTAWERWLECKAEEND